MSIISDIKNGKYFEGDGFVWLILIMLCGISLIEVYSASSNLSYTSGKYYSPIMEHGVYMAAGFFVACFLQKLPCKFFKLICVIGIVVSFLLLIYAQVGGTEANGAERWVNIAGKTIQPSEFAKISIIGTVAFMMAVFRTKDDKLSKPGLKIIVTLTLVMCALIVTENFSTAALLFLVIWGMLWIGDANKKIIFGVIIAMLAIGSAGIIGVKTMSEETAQSLGELPGMHRVPTWVHRIQKSKALPEDPKEYDVSSNVQVAHAQIAIATCGITGKGPGKSVERDYLPQAYSDFIYAIIIEEWGVIGAFLVIALYLLLFYRALRIAGRCKQRFPAYLVMGLALMLVFQAFINMAVAVGLAPVTGQPLPMVSRGGTSTILTCCYLGMILSVSKTAKKIDEEAETATQTATQTA